MRVQQKNLEKRKEKEKIEAKNNKKRKSSVTSEAC